MGVWNKSGGWKKSRNLIVRRTIAQYTIVYTDFEQCLNGFVNMCYRYCRWKPQLNFEMSTTTNKVHIVTNYSFDITRF